VRLSPGARVLDIGCGLGHDLVEMGAAVGPHGVVSGVDVNAELVELARERVRAAAGPSSAAMSVSVADARALPRDLGGAFDLVREDRVLQHLPSPREMVLEMTRVARPDGGVVCCSSPDWRTLRLTGAAGEPLSAELASLSAAVLRVAAPICTCHPCLGAELRELLSSCGLREVRTRSHVLSMRSWGDVQALVVLEHMAEVAVCAGLPKDEADRWVELLALEGQSGRVRGTLTIHTACGVRSCR
jgi:SAM-dependent methyltransferase